MFFWILQYLKKYPGTGPLFRKSNKKDVVVFTDADWAGCFTDQRSPPVIVYLFGGIWLLGKARNDLRSLGAMLKLSSRQCVKTRTYLARKNAERVCLGRALCEPSLSRASV